MVKYNDFMEDKIFYINLLKSNHEWLIDRMNHYASQNKFTRYLLTLQNDWQSSVIQISDSLIRVAELVKFTIPDFNPDANYSEDPVTMFGISELYKLRENGTSPAMFLTLLKNYRQCYMDLFDIQNIEYKNLPMCRLFTSRCFDRMEIVCASEWSMKSKEDFVSELQSANRILANEKKKYQDIFESFYSPVIILNHEKKIVNINRAAAKLIRESSTFPPLQSISVPEDEILKNLDKKLDDFIKSSLEELAFETFLEIFETDKFFLIKFKKMNGINGNLNGIIVILDDFTERKDIENHYEHAKLRAEESDHLKTAFLANMSHEIRTPMNAIIGFSDLLLNESIQSDARKEYLKIIQKSGNSLLRIIDDIIDIAKIEARQIIIHPRDFKISELLDDLFSIFIEFIKKEDDKDIRLILCVDNSDKDIILFTDPNRLKQVFINLLNNALKFTHHGFIEFGCNIVDDNNVYFYVKDTGIGIPKEKQALIFERFVRIRSNYTKEYNGTGLGLAITQNIVNLMGGSIWVESEPDKGTTFHVVLPMKYAGEALNEKSELQLSDIKKKISFRKYKILIAEDEEINYYYLFEILKKTGAKILWARNGLEAINLAESNPDIDLVLMDIKMPEINGLEALKYLQTIRPGLPVIAQTALVMDNDRDLCLNSGCVDFLSKPIKASHLLGIIDKYIGNNPTAKNQAKSFAP